MLLISSSKMMVAIWAYDTPQDCLTNVHGVVHIIKQMGLDMKFQETVSTAKNLKINWEIAKDAYSKAKKTTGKRRAVTPSCSCCSGQIDFDKALIIWKEAEAKTGGIGAQIFQIFANLQSDESCQPWDKIVKALTEFSPSEDLKEQVHGNEKCANEGGSAWTRSIDKMSIMDWSFNNVKPELSI